MRDKLEGKTEDDRKKRKVRHERGGGGGGVEWQPPVPQGKENIEKLFACTEKE